MPPSDGDRAPDFEALLCDGETFQSTALSAVTGDRGLILVFSGFAFSAIAENWWKRYERAGWHEFEGVPVVGASRDGPYAQNAFLRALDSPFRLFSDVDGAAATAFDLLVDRDGMANVSTARRAVFVLEPDRSVAHAWVADDWISPVPREELEDTVDRL